MKKHKARKVKKNTQKSKRQPLMSVIWRIALKNPDRMYQVVMGFLDWLEQMGS